MKIAHKKVLIFVLFLASTFCQLPEDDQVDTSIPGYNHRIYSGYLDISISSHAKSIHYVYFQSQNNVAKDPVLLWLAGGPGCSGLVSMLQQHGPFTIIDGTHDLQLNQNAWNKRAGLIYFEGPAGVGYSQSLSNQTITDQIAAGQFINALRIFLDRHANLKKNDIYIAGSGYGAVFTTYLSRYIIDANKDESLIYWSKINLKGILLGNPCVYPDECYASGSQRNTLYHYEFLYNRGFMPKKWYLQVLSKCTMGNPYDCYMVRQRVDKEYNATNTSAYNIYAKCYKKPNPNTINLGCEDQQGIIQYLNDPHFRQNWNIRLNLQWTPCSTKIWNEYHSGNGSYHLIHNLVKDGLRVWVYSGDMDSTVPITGTRKWLSYYIRQYEVPIKKNWREWWIPGRHKGQDQVGGFIWQIEGLTAVLVKGAGFKAGYNQPVSMEQVLNGFLDGKTLPYKA